MHQSDEAVGPERIGKLDRDYFTCVLQTTSRIRDVIPIGNEDIFRIRGVRSDNVRRQVLVSRVGQ